MDQATGLDLPEIQADSLESLLGCEERGQPAAVGRDTEAQYLRIVSLQSGKHPPGRHLGDGDLVWLVSDEEELAGIRREMHIARAWYPLCKSADFLACLRIQERNPPLISPNDHAFVGSQPMPIRSKIGLRAGEMT